MIQPQGDERLKVDPSLLHHVPAFAPLLLRFTIVLGENEPLKRHWQVLEVENRCKEAATLGEKVHVENGKVIVRRGLRGGVYVLCKMEPGGTAVEVGLSSPLVLPGPTGARTLGSPTMRGDVQIMVTGISLAQGDRCAHRAVLPKSSSAPVSLSCPPVPQLAPSSCISP